mmetsp:Transcript_62307/g.150869  ORF Transcript_62307/g.150869 Transcript_62307/m.150869 type:complete len:257 (+) Transcript_62307:376-1146(+)
MNRPYTNAPVLGCAVTSSGEAIAVMSVATTILSSGSPVWRAVTCIMAVRKAIGLNRPGSHRHSGRSSSDDQRSNCSTRRSSSRNHDCSPFFDGQAFFSQLVLWNGLRPGTSLMDSAAFRSSIGSDMFNCPFMPFSSSISEKRIIESSVFMRPHSCIATSTKGDRSGTLRSGSAIMWISIITKFSGKRFKMSVIVARTASSPLSPAPPPDPPSRAMMVWNRSLHVDVRYPISALGCSPKIGGTSGGSFSSMCCAMPA